MNTIQKSELNAFIKKYKDQGLIDDFTKVNVCLNKGEVVQFAGVDKAFGWKTYDMDGYDNVTTMTICELLQYVNVKES